VTDVPVLDTHAWIWWMDRDARLGKSALTALDALPPSSRPYVCAISLWEVAMLVERKRLAFTLPLQDWLDAASHHRSVQLVGITPRIAAEVASLPAAFHRDPADRLIVATCRVMGAPLLTSDRRIRQARLTRRWAPS
jgi:PIN domain nuclease of toxin-antitoxin system